MFKKNIFTAIFSQGMNLLSFFQVCVFSMLIMNLNMKLETLSPKINFHVLMLLKMTPYNEIGPHNISQMPGVNIQVSSYKKFEVTHVSKRGILISHLI